MADLTMTKRAAMHAGEIGLFVDSPVFESEFQLIKIGVGLEVKATQPRSLPQMRHAWALATKISDSGVLGDCSQRETMDYLLLKARHVRYITNVHRDGMETTAVVKSIRFASMDQTAFQRLYNRMIHIVATEILPDMPEGELRTEVERMAGVAAPEAPKEKPKRRRRSAEEVATDAETKQRNPLPAPVSVIPPHDPETGEVIEPPADATPPAPQASATSAPPPPAAMGGSAAPTVGALPKNFPEWKDYCFAWLTVIDDDDSKTDIDVLTRWQGETKLRNACGITAEERSQLFAFMNAIVEKKREAQGKRVQP